MNSELLREAMRSKSITVVQMCREIGISRKAFWSKCKGKTEFKQSEIAKIIELLGDEYGTAIFFPTSVAKDTRRQAER